MAKGNIKSIRFSDEILTIIEAQPGETFTAKYEGLIRTCFQELPQKQKELENIQAQIQAERTRLRRIRDQGNKLERTMNDLKWSMDNITRQTKQATSALGELIGEV